MSENNQPVRVKLEKPESFSDTKKRQKSVEEIQTIVNALKEQSEVKPEHYPKILSGLGITMEEAAPFLDENIPVMEEVYAAPPVVTQEKKTFNAKGNYKVDLKSEKMYEAATDMLDLPSKGVFYPNNQDKVKIKYLTALEDDILFTPELIMQNKQLHALLESAVVDKTLRPENMISGDRNYVLIELRRTGFGDEYQPGPMQCRSCMMIHNPIVDLSLLKVKEVKELPDENKEYYLELPKSKARIKFRLLNGKDELSLQSKGVDQVKRDGKLAVKRMWTERYVLQIMEVNEQRDKIFIKSFSEAMPLQDSQFFREYVSEVEPGIDLNYEFVCPHCGKPEQRPVPINPRLFYPDAEI